jgi:chromosome segregation ATPase
VTPDDAAPLPQLDSIPVQRTLADRLLFRSAESIRKKIFSAPEHDLPAREKKKRFADNAADYICQVSVDAMSSDLDRTEEVYWRPATAAYVSSLDELIRKDFSQATAALNTQRAALETEHSNLGSMTSQIHELEEVAGKIRAEIDRLEEKHRETVRQLQGGLDNPGA